MADVAVDELLERGERTLRAGDWDGARAAFEAALERDPSPDAEEGLGRALWWLQDLDGAMLHLERAYAGFRDEDDKPRAARTALWLSREYQAVHGNAAASNGWYARAEGLLRETAPSGDHGWLALTRAERTADPAEMRGHAEEAHAIAIRAGDRDLETAALARLGLRGGGRRRRRPRNGQARRVDGRGDGRRGRQPGRDRRRDLRRDRRVRAVVGLEADRAVGPGDGLVDPEPQRRLGARFLLRLLRGDVPRLGRVGSSRRPARRGPGRLAGSRTPITMRASGGEARRAAADPGPARGGRAAPHGVRGSSRGGTWDRAPAAAPRSGRALRGHGPSTPQPDRGRQRPRGAVPLDARRRAARAGRHRRRGRIGRPTGDGGSEVGDRSDRRRRRTWRTGGSPSRGEPRTPPSTSSRP